MVPSPQEKIMSDTLSPLARALRGLLVDTDFFTIQEWAQFIEVFPDEAKVLVGKIEDWLNDRDIPEPKHMGRILDVLRNSSDPDNKIAPALDYFWNVMQMVPRNVSPHIEKILGPMRIHTHGNLIRTIHLPWVTFFTESSYFEGFCNGLKLLHPSKIDEFMQAVCTLRNSRTDWDRDSEPFPSEPLQPPAAPK